MNKTYRSSNSYLLAGPPTFKQVGELGRRQHGKVELRARLGWLGLPIHRGLQGLYLLVEAELGVGQV